MTSGLYYKHSRIANDYSSIINKFEASFTEDASRHLRSSHVYSTGQRNTKMSNTSCSQLVVPGAFIGCSQMTSNLASGLGEQEISLGDPKGC